MVGKACPYTTGSIDFKNNISHCLLSQMDSDRYEIARELFSYLDNDKKGFIAVDELSILSSVCEDFTESQLSSIFSVLDKEGNGRITLEDFTEAFVTLESLSKAENDKEDHDGLAMKIDCPNLDQYDVQTIEIQDAEQMTTDNVQLKDGEIFEFDDNEREPKSYCNGKNDEDGISNSDDIFEGEGQLSVEVQSLSSSPVARSPLRGPKVRSPSLRARVGSRNDHNLDNSNEVEGQIRLPPDGGEGNHSNQLSPKNSLHTKQNLNKHKFACNADLQAKGFAKTAINDLLKIVDSHTLSSLGVYGNERSSVWRHDINWNVQGESLSDDRKCPPWLRMSQDWSECTERSGSESRESKLTTDVQESASESELPNVINQHKSCNSCGGSINSEDGIPTISTQKACDCDGSMLSPNSYSECSQSDCYIEFDAEKPVFSPDQIDENAINGNQKMQIGASVDKDVGNIIYDDREGNHAKLYDKILNCSGVELSSRMSTSETSLHELLLEAEAVRNNASLIEDWDLVMKRINGTAVFGGNQTVRYLWQQLSIYNSDLIQPFEDFLKSIINEIQRAYTKCHELDRTLNSKTEQHERELARMYDEMDQLLLREKETLQEKHNEREEHQKCDFNRTIDMKEAELQEAIKARAEVEARLESVVEDYHVLKHGKERLEKQFKLSQSSEMQLRQEIDNLLKDNRAISAKLNRSNRDLIEMQEQNIKLSKIAETNKENYQKCLQQFQNAIEEKEYFDVSISNLTQELQDLRNTNKTLQEQMDSSLNRSLFWREDQSSPNSPRREFLADKQRKTSPSPLSNEFLQKTHPQTPPYSKPNHPDSRTSTPISRYSENRGNANTSYRSQVTSTKKTPQSDKATRKSIAFEPVEERKIICNSKSRTTPSKEISNVIPVLTGREYKVIFVGDSSVGKTSLIRKMCKGTFKSERERTTCPDYQQKSVTVNNTSLTLNLWDTVGQERSTYVLKAEGFKQQLIFRFNSLPPSYFRKADAVVLVYDLIEEVSFINIKSWIKTINEYIDENVVLILCGNKSDLDHKRQVKVDRAVKLAKMNDAIFIESSAKTGYNVVKLCDTIASTLLEKDDTVVIREKSVKLLDPDFINISIPKASKSCC